MNSQQPPAIAVRLAVTADVPQLIELIRELAEYEQRLADVVIRPEMLAEALFGAQPVIGATLAEVDGRVAGGTVFLHTFSTFRGQRNLYIEDLFVRPPFRRMGVGQALVAHLARLALERRCGRLEWSVLTWNEPAIEFYRRLGARPVRDWAVYELSGAALAELASEAGPSEPGPS